MGLNCRQSTESPAMASPIISYRLTDEEVAVIKDQALPGESLNQTAQRLMRQQLTQIAPTLPAKQSTVKQPVNSVDRDWVEDLVRSVYFRATHEMEKAIGNIREEFNQRLGEWNA